MGRNTDGDSRSACCDDVRHCRTLLHDQRQRAGPEASGQSSGCLRPTGGELINLSRIGQMDDQRVVRRATFGDEDPRRRRCVHGIGAQAVDGFGREGDQLPGSQHGRGACNDFRARVSGIELKNFSVQTQSGGGNGEWSRGMQGAGLLSFSSPATLTQVANFKGDLSIWGRGCRLSEMVGNCGENKSSEKPNSQSFALRRFGTCGGCCQRPMP